MSDPVSSPEAKLLKIFSDFEKYHDLEDYLNERILGQTGVIHAIAEKIRKTKINLGNPRRPLASFLFLGSTGVGKTETILHLAEYIYGSKEHLARFDMALYQKQEDIDTLIGVKGEADGVLAEEILRLNKIGGGILLIDEIEKANSSLVKIFLSALDEARITTPNGTLLKLNNLYIFITSNLGGKNASKMNTDNFTTFQKVMLKECKKFFVPEFLARIDCKLVFEVLNKEVLAKIAKLYLDAKINQIKENYGFDVTMTEGVLKHIVEAEYDPEEGARPIKQTVEDEVGKAFLDLFDQLRNDPFSEIVDLMQVNEIQFYLREYMDNTGRRPKPMNKLQIKITNKIIEGRYYEDQKMA
jgi:ATP-dependent Clp protease ATP-binding subunit ClpA